MESLEGKTIALLATNGFEDVELTEPLNAIKEAGAVVEIISDQDNTITGKNGTEIEVDTHINDAVADNYGGLLLPGGVENPDVMRQNSVAVDFVGEFFVSNKPVAAICHAPWLLVEANVIEGRTLTSWPSLRTDIENAGGHWVDEEFVIDGNLVTSRNPDDIPVFSTKAVELFASSDTSK